MMEELKDITAKINKYTIVSYYWFHPYENKENINNAINYLKNIPNGG
jgi:hypothetical protein